MIYHLEYGYQISDTNLFDQEKLILYYFKYCSKRKKKKKVTANMHGFIALLKNAF